MGGVTLEGWAEATYLVSQAMVWMLFEVHGGHGLDSEENGTECEPRVGLLLSK